MRSVFSRMRDRRLEAPAWAGGLKYDDLPVMRPQSARTHSEDAKSSLTPSSGRLRGSTAASGAQTRMAMTPRRDPVVNSVDGTPALVDGAGGGGQRRAFVGSSGAAGNGGRPLTSGGEHGRRRGGGAAAQQPGGRRLRPNTADAGSPRRRPASGPSKHEGRPQSAGVRRSGMAIGSGGEGGAAAAAGGVGQAQVGGRVLPGVAGKPVGSTFYNLNVRILGVKGMSHVVEQRDPNFGRPVNSANEAENEIMYVYMVLNVEGITHQSKAVRMQSFRSVMVPDEMFEFELQGNVLGTLLSIKVFKVLRHGDAGGSHKEASPEIGAAYVELAACLHSGGHKVSVCKLSHDSHIGSVGEAQLDLRLFSRPLDFTFSYTGDTPVFRKAGYTITPDGIKAMPQAFKVKGLPPGETIRTLTMDKVVSSEVPGLRVWRAVDTKQKNTYTVKRFALTEFDPRRMLVNELDGLIDCLQQHAITPLDAFLDRLEVVLVLDDMGGRYLRDVVERKGKLPEQNGSIVLRQVLQAVRHLHENKLRVHNDIDARNILVLKTGEVRLGGFCYSTRNVGAAQKFAGPYVHMSPERLLGLDCGVASDSWSVGILAMELLCGKPAYDMSRFSGPTALFEFKKMVVTEPSPSLKRGDDYSDEVRLFVDSCLPKNLKLRLSVSGLLSHPFITKYESFMPNFLGRWISKENKAKRRASVGSFDGDGKKENIFALLQKSTGAEGGGEAKDE